MNPWGKMIVRYKVYYTEKQWSCLFEAMHKYTGEKTAPDLEQHTPAWWKDHALSDETPFRLYWDAHEWQNAFAALSMGKSLIDPEAALAEHPMIAEAYRQQPNLEKEIRDIAANVDTTSCCAGDVCEGHEPAANAAKVVATATARVIELEKGDDETPTEGADDADNSGTDAPVIADADAAGLDGAAGESFQGVADADVTSVD